MRTFFVPALLIGLTGCVSHSARVYYNLDAKDPAVRTPQCKRALKAVGFQEDVRVARLAVGPAIVLLTGGLSLIPYAAGHAALEAFDMQQAEEISKYCRSNANPKDQEKQ
jgi:hypothetical protein